MPNKRRPIEYAPQFAPGIFRGPREVERERDSLSEGVAETAESHVTPLDSRRPGAAMSPAPNERTNERTNERLSERSNERPDDAVQEPRRRIRHSFDIWEDQLLSLAELQARLFTTTRRKPKLGELVQEALDRYIQRQTTTGAQPNVRTNGRTRRGR